MAGLDLMDALLLMGVLSLTAGSAAIYRPAGAIVFGFLCLGFWMRKQQTVTEKR
jgi:hypothetical protein